ncbi:MAG TPA: alpha/beta hydrolase [Aliidongia sp.]|nr:alpha/beta hydrolase [Aliidongia sp.]
MELYRGMDRAALDAAYNNSAAVPDVADKVADWLQRSEKARATLGGERDLRYGPGERQRIDWFPAAAPHAPTLVFIHGGYWQARDKEDFSFVAEGPVARGFNTALVEYTLAPAARMTEIVGEIGHALDFLAAKLPSLGAARGPLCLAGHSAGGHLAASHRGHRAVSAVLGISGLYELEPISLNYLNDKLRLDAAEVAAFSPIRHIRTGARLLLTVGGIELPELIRQTEDYAAAARAAGEAVTLIPAPGHDHFTVLENLARPDGPALEALTRLFS